MDVGSSRQTLSTVTGAAGVEPMMVDYPDRAGMWLCDHVCRLKAYGILGSEGIETNALPKDIRARLIRPAALETFNSKSEKQSWRISTYHAGSTKVNLVNEAWRYQDIIDALQGTTKMFHQLDEANLMPLEYLSDLTGAKCIRFTYGQVELEARYPSRRRPEIFICDPDPSLKFGRLQVELPSLPAGAEGKFIIVLFDRPIKKIQAEGQESKPDVAGTSKSVGKKVPKKMARKIDPVYLQTISSHRSVKVASVFLAPQEWALFRKSGANWEMEFKSVRQGVELIPNPLLRESGPAVVNRQDVLLVHKNDGELYLNKTMLTHLYNKKFAESIKNLTDDEKAEIPPWHYLSTLQSFEPLKALGNRYHFFLERPNSGHTVGVYVNANAADDNVHIYLHETEGATESTSQLIRQTVIKKMKLLYPDRKIKLFYPKPMLQRDFVSCGVFAFKAMSFFRKHPEEMDQWLESMKSEAVYDGEVGEVVIPLQGLKPGLLKEYHYALEPDRPEAPRLSQAQRKTIVNKKQETLEQYLGKFERQTRRLGREGTTTINTGSFYHRYKMIETYQSDIEQQQRLLSEAAELPENSRKRKRLEEPEFYSCPQDIVDSYELSEINAWLQEEGGETMTQKELDKIMRYERHYSSGKKKSELKLKHPHTYQWVKKAKKTDPATPKGALMQHWLVGEPATTKPTKTRSID